MKAITTNNYESFFLDYIEGRLDAGHIAALMGFLDEHPELKEELQGLELITIEPDTSISYGNRESLKKTAIMPYGELNESNYEEVFAAFAEGDLPANAIAEVKHFISMNPQLDHELELLKQCRLQPNNEVMFPGKSSLKKPVIIPFITRRLYYGIAVAASMALLIGLSFLFEREPTKNNQVTVVEPMVPEQVEDLGPTGMENVISEQNLTSLPGNQVAVNLAESQPEPTLTEEHGFSKIQIQNRNNNTLSHLAFINISDDAFSSEVPKPVINELKYISDYYADIAIAQNIRHAETPEEQLSTERLLAQGTAVVKEIMQPGEEDLRILPEQIDLWKVADAGINGFARLTGADLEFRKTTDSEGRVTAFAFESQSMVINRNLRKNK